MTPGEIIKCLMDPNVISMLKTYGVATGAIGSIIGVITGALFTYLFNIMRDRKKSRFNVALSLISEHDSKFEKLKKAREVLVNESVMITDTDADTKADNFNKVIQMGNWYEIVIVVYNENYAEKKLLKTAGLVDAAKEFSKSIKASKNFKKYLKKDWRNLGVLI